MKNIGKLTIKRVEAARNRGYYSDGGGLYLCVGATGSKSWVFRFRVNGRLREMGLGPVHTVTLAEAREKARECRIKRLEDVDPIDVRQQARIQAKLEQAKLITFEQAARQYAETHSASWTAIGHQKEWIRSLERYVFPSIGALPVQSIDTTLVLKTLEPIWITRHVSATRIRGRIEAIMDWARSRGYREGENPARWRGHLENLLPSGVHQVEHFAALPYDDLAAFMARLTQQPDAAARALEFTILTVARSGMIRGLKPAEFDFQSRVWTVPAARMKGRKSYRREFRIPLSNRAQQTAETILETPQGFRGKTAMVAVLRRMGFPDLTVHGFRSTFADWCSEQTSFPSEVREMVLAHTIGDKTEAAYRRGDLFEKRRELMNTWAQRCFPSAVW